MLLSEEEIIKKSLPTEDYIMSCVYFLIRKGEVVYVGQSTKGFYRVLTHVGQKEFDSFSFVECSEENLDEMEAMYIAKLSPAHNHVMPNNSIFKSMEQLKKITGYNKWKLKKIIKKNNIKIYSPHHYKLNEILDAIHPSEKARIEAEVVNNYA